MFSLPEQGLLTKQYGELITISTDTGLKDTYTNICLINFQAGLKEDFPQVSNVAVKKQLPFPSTYLCETAFSRCAVTKTKYRHGFNVEEFMKIQLSRTVPDFNPLVTSKKVHLLHYVSTTKTVS
jgi:hypothetical protein